MMTHCIQFSDDLETAANRQIALCLSLWSQAKPRPDRPVRIVAGNYAGYGAYVARCHPSGVIEFALGNRFAVVRLSGSEITFRGRLQAFLSVLTHEVGHHVVQTARFHPWTKLPPCGSSTHLCRPWIWICCTAWAHYHQETPSPAAIADALLGEENAVRRRVIRALERFDPFEQPPLPTEPDPRCEYCGTSLQEKRRGARYCGTRCRVTAHRVRQRSSESVQTTGD